MKNETDFLIPLSEKELRETDGGTVALFIASAALGLACVYYAGYAVGRLLCD